VKTYHRDGASRFDGNGEGSVNYEPNSFDGPVQDPRVREPALALQGDADRFDHRQGNEDYSQAGALYRLMSPAQKDQLIGNLLAVLQTVPRAIQLRQLAQFRRADSGYGARIAAGLDISAKEAAQGENS
jgi:catalase